MGRKLVLRTLFTGALCFLPCTASADPLATDVACLDVGAHGIGQLPRTLTVACESSRRSIKVGPGGCFPAPPATCAVVVEGQELVRRGGLRSPARYHWPPEERALLVNVRGFQLRAVELRSTFPAHQLFRDGPTLYHRTRKWYFSHEGQISTARAATEEMARLLRDAQSGKRTPSAIAMRLELAGNHAAALEAYKRAMQSPTSRNTQLLLLSRIADLSLLTSPHAQRVPTRRIVEKLLAERRKLTRLLASSDDWRCYLRQSTVSAWKYAFLAATTRRTLLDALHRPPNSSTPTVPVAFKRHAMRQILADNKRSTCTSPLDDMIVHLRTKDASASRMPARYRHSRAPLRSHTLLVRKRGHFSPLLTRGRQFIVLSPCQSVSAFRRLLRRKNAELEPLKAKATVVTAQSCADTSIGQVNDETRWALRWPKQLGYGVFSNRRLLFAAPLSLTRDSLDTALSIAKEHWLRSRGAKRP